jgi:hypothetical protein
MDKYHKKKHIVGDLYSANHSIGNITTDIFIERNIALNKKIIGIDSVGKFIGDYGILLTK